MGTISVAMQAERNFSESVGPEVAVLKWLLLQHNLLMNTYLHVYLQIVTALPSTYPAILDQLRDIN
jgi:hypothetical protein